MSVLLCGSLAFDTITNFPGRFGEHILADQIHILNVCFVVPTLRREYGGCAGNIAYSLRLLGADVHLVGTLGSDANDYMARLKSWGLDTSNVRQEADLFTAQAIIVTDEDNNQITAFHPGAMDRAHLNPIVHDPSTVLGLVSPDGREAMVVHARQMHEAGLPFIFDPGQALPMFNGEELSTFLGQATWLAVNDYEARLLCDRVGSSLEALSRGNLKGIVVTLGAHGCEIWEDGQRTHVPGAPAQAVVDPTGCGDAFRAALLFGLERGWSLRRCAELGNQVGARKIASRGCQNHRFDDLLSLLG